MSEESPHFTALRKQDRLNRLATESFRVAGGKVEKYRVAPPAHDIEAVIAAMAADKKAREEAYAKIIAAAKPGDMIEGHGIFLGTWEPEDSKGSLGKLFNVFAAPEDLQGTMTYRDAVESVARLKDWNGHDGANYANDDELYEALGDGRYNGEWVIPPMIIWTGYDSIGCNSTMPDNFFANNDPEAFTGLFSTGGDDWYWTSTPLEPGRMKFINVIQLAHGGDMPATAATPNLCRPIRLEPKL